MSKKKSQPGSKRKDSKPAMGMNQPAIGDSLRQWLQPAQFRIHPPAICLGGIGEFHVEPCSKNVPKSQPPVSYVSPASDQAIAEVATCLWYLKTKHFKRSWDAEDGGDDDPRVRRALGRLNKGIDALKREGVEIQDPVNKRYAPGSEGTMRPIQFDPTPGLDHQRVSETVTPIVYLKGRIIQPGEVFVAVPEEAPSQPRQQGICSESAGAADSTGIIKQATVPASAETAIPPVDPAAETLVPREGHGKATPKAGENTMSDGAGRSKKQQE